MAQLLVLNLIAFVAAISFGFTLTTLVTRMRRKAAVTADTPRENSLLRVSAGTAVYRSRFLGASSEGWAFAAPLQRDNYVPIRVDQTLVVEVEDAFGRRIFRSTLISRNAETGVMVMAKPARIYRLKAESDVSAEQMAHQSMPFLS